MTETLNATSNAPNVSSSKNGYAMDSMESVIMRKCLKFFSQKYNLNQMLPIVCGADELSLQILDWSVTNYSKQFNVIYSIKKGTNIRQFDVYNDYKSNLKSYTKDYFDPFCRDNKIYFEYEEGAGIETSVGQLNFFYWAIENKFLDWVRVHMNEIVEHKKQTKLKQHDGVKKRQLSVAASKTISQQDVKVTIKFD